MKPWLFSYDLPLIGEFAISSYFLWLVVGCTLAVNVAVREARRSGESPREALLLGLFGIAAGAVGARVGHILTSPSIYLAEPMRLLQFWRGGLVFYGGLIGGVLGGLVFCRARGLGFLRMGDVTAPAILMGLAFGRVGCFSAGCCYGRPIDWGSGIEWPWGAVFLSGHVPTALRGIPLHPTQGYETWAALALFGFLGWMRRRQRFDGQVLGLLLVGYALVRPILELFRFDAERGFAFEGLLGPVVSTSQAISLTLLPVGIALLVVSGRRARARGLHGLGPRAAGEAIERQRLRAAGRAVLPGNS